MATFISHSPAETEALGAEWGQAAESGLVIALCGDLGAGKTQLVKGLARGLGITARVQSPSFALVNVYQGRRLKLFHLDLYRLDTPAQIAAAGLDEFLQPAGVSVIEWAERWDEIRNLKPIQNRNHKALEEQGKSKTPRLMWVQLDATGETERRITYEDFGN